MHDIDRRMILAGALGAALASGTAGAQDRPGAGGKPPGPDLSTLPPAWLGKEQVAILLYDDMMALDVVGPQYMLTGLFGATVRTVAKTAAPVRSDNGLVLVPDMAMADCPPDLDILLVGGGLAGTLAAINDRETVDFVSDRGGRAKWVASVCTGSLLLRQAGLLRGYRATSHWIGRPLLADYGAVPVDERVVFDRNRATGAGVSAGIDLGLALLARLRPRNLAETMQLAVEYAPEPPLDAGTPDTASPAVVEGVRRHSEGFVAGVRDAARTARG